MRVLAILGLVAFACWGCRSPLRRANEVLIESDPPLSATNDPQQSEAPSAESKSAESAAASPASSKSGDDQSPQGTLGSELEQSVTDLVAAGVLDASDERQLRSD